MLNDTDVSFLTAVVGMFWKAYSYCFPETKGCTFERSIKNF